MIADGNRFSAFCLRSSVVSQMAIVPLVSTLLFNYFMTCCFFHKHVLLSKMIVFENSEPQC